MSDPTRQDMNAALLAYKGKYDQFSVRALLESVAKVKAMSEVREHQFAAVIAACAKPPSAYGVEPRDDFGTGASKAKTPKSMAELDTKEIYARWNSAKGRSAES